LLLPQAASFREQADTNSRRTTGSTRRIGAILSFLDGPPVPTRSLAWGWWVSDRQRFQLIIQCSNRRLEHLAMRGRPGGGQIGDGASACEFEQPATFDARGLLGRNGRCLLASRGLLLLLRLDRLRFPPAGHGQLNRTGNISPQCLFAASSVRSTPRWS